jgi:hypothetical protein
MREDMSYVPKKFKWERSCYLNGHSSLGVYGIASYSDSA